MASTKAIIVGLGPLGQNLAKALVKDERFELIGLIDKDPNKIGTELHKILITDSLDGINAELAFVTTSSKLTQIEETLKELAQKNINIISSCEELIYPWQANPDLAQNLDDMAKAYGVRVLGTGINPGFLMDYFLITLLKAQINSSIDSIYYERVIDTNKRRIPFQNKVAVGLTKEEYDKAFSEGRIGHVGCRQSVDMLLDYLNWTLEDYQEDIEPLFSGDKIIGINQVAKALCKNGKEINLVFNANSQNQDKDLIKINSAQSLELEFKGGVDGENGTVAMLINCANQLIQTQPGLKTMLELAA